MSIPPIAKNVERAIRKNTRMVYVETPTNPLMSMSDIAPSARSAGGKKVDLVVDNTFMSPYFQQPIALGADMVVHSTTKFLNGHSDGLGGVVVCTQQEQAEKLAFRAESRGSDSFSFRVLAGAARGQNPGGAHGAARPQRPSRGRISGPP